MMALKRLFAVLQARSMDSPNERLIAACKDLANPHRASLVRQALADGANPDCDIGNYKYPTLLIHEVIRHTDETGIDFEVMDLLIDAGADLYVDMPHAAGGEGAFGFAVGQDRYKVAHHLIAKGADVNRHGAFWDFLAYHHNDGFDSRDVEMARAMVMAGGDVTPEMIAYMRDSLPGYLLTYREKFWEPGAPTMIDLLLQWAAEMRAAELLDVLVAVKEQPMVAKPRL